MSKKSKKSVELDELPPIRAFDRVFDEWNVVSDKKDRNKLARSALLTWDGAHLPTLWLFVTEKARDAKQEKLHINSRLALQALVLHKPIRIRTRSFPSPVWKRVSSTS